MTQQRSLNDRIWSALRLLLAAASLLSAMPAQALERVTLANGFEIDCVRQEPQADGLVRLYLAPAGASENYMDVSAAAIVRIEKLPDLPAPGETAVVTPGAGAAGAGLKDNRSQPTAVELTQMLAHAGRAHNVDADLLAAVMQAESGGHAHAVSRTGARGLMQLMPATAETLGVADAFVPADNVEGGTRYLDQLLTRYHDNIALALAAYNAGPGAVDRFKGLPPYRETRAYVARVIREFNHRKTVLLATVTPAIR